MWRNICIYHVYHAYMIDTCDKSSETEAWSVECDGFWWDSILISYSEFFYRKQFEALSCKPTITHFRPFSSNPYICHQSTFCFSGFVSSGPWVYMVFIQHVVFGGWIFSHHNILKTRPSHNLYGFLLVYGMGLYI